jgi:hypothetical protein
MNTLFTTISDAGSGDSAESDAFHSETSDSGSDEQNGDQPKMARVINGQGDSKFFVGQWVDVRDTVNQWLAATIMDIDRDSRRIYIHFNGWPVRWDEWLDWGSPRVAPFRSHSVHDGTSHHSPSLTTRETTATTTGRDDIRTLVPEVASLMQRLSPMMSSLAELCVDSLAAEPDSATTSHGSPHSNAPMPWTRHLPHHNEQASSRQAVHSEPALRHLASELSPLLDRFGRLLSDLSPHLRVLAEPDAVETETRDLSQTPQPR